MKRWAYILVPILILLSLICWRIVQKRADTNIQMSQRKARMSAPAVVSLAPAEIRDIVQTLEATGSVEAPLNVKIAPKITGRIEYFQLHEGDPVKKGQVLVRIDPAEVEAEVRQSRASVAEAEYRLAQAQLTENATNVGVSTQIRQQRAGAASGEADFNQVRQNYEAQVAAADANVSDTKSRISSGKRRCEQRQGQPGKRQHKVQP